MSTSVFGCEITLHGLHICDNTFLSWQARLFSFFFCFFPFFSPLFRVRLCRPSAYLVTAVVTVSMTAILFGPLILPPAERSGGRGGGVEGGGIQRQFQLAAQITFQTSQTEYLTLLWFFDKRYGGIFIDSGTRFNFLSVRRGGRELSCRLSRSSGCLDIDGVPVLCHYTGSVA